MKKILLLDAINFQNTYNSKTYNELKIIHLRMPDQSIDQDKSDISIINFHGLTIEIVDGQPDMIIYLPPNIDQVKQENELLDLVYNELIYHLLEVNEMIHSRFIIICYQSNSMEIRQILDKFQNLEKIILPPLSKNEGNESLILELEKFLKIA